MTETAEDPPVYLCSECAWPFHGTRGPEFQVQDSYPGHYLCNLCQKRKCEMLGVPVMWSLQDHLRSFVESGNKNIMAAFPTKILIPPHLRDLVLEHLEIKPTAVKTRERGKKGRPR